MECDYLSIIIESASKIAVTMKNRGNSNLWEDEVWIVDILAYVENFEFISFNFVK